MGASTESERRLMAYMVGFRMGVNAAALTLVNKMDDDLMTGYEAGREAKRTAYGSASRIYGVTLSPFRHESPILTVAEYDRCYKGSPTEEG